MSILAVQPGAYYHLESLEAPRYRAYFDALVRPEDLSITQLEDFNVVLVPCRTPADRMIPHAAQLANYLQQGGTIVATGESRSDLWLPGVTFHKQACNYWWWLQQDADLGIKVTAPDHDLFNFVDPTALSWHLHGWLEADDGVEVLATNAEAGPILMIDQVTTAGRMVLTTLDPFFHHGSHFMPATTTFLDGFLAWVRNTLDTNPSNN